MNFIDTHAHLYLKEFDADRDQMVLRALDSKVEKIILPNIDLESLPAVIDLADRFPNICYAAIGLHPCDAKANYMEVLTEMEKEISSSNFIAIGETGTDAFWDTTYWKEQLNSFSIQLEWSKQTGKPIIIHSRETIDQNIDLVKQHQDGRLTGIFHCFTGTVEQAKEIIALGFYLGIGGVLTYKKSGLKEVIQELGIEHLVLETDAPFLTPVPHRGKRNESSYIPLIAKSLSEAINISMEEIARITSENARKVFQLNELG